MAKPKPNLAGAFDGLQVSVPAADPVRTRSRRASVVSDGGPETVLVGANLPPRYARNLAMLHAETGRSKKELLQEALDMFFVSKGGAGIRL